MSRFADTAAVTLYTGHIRDNETSGGHISKAHDVAITLLPNVTQKATTEQCALRDRRSPRDVRRWALGVHPPDSRRCAGEFS